MIFPLLLLSYPIVLHFSIFFNHIDMAVVYLAFLLSLPVISSLIRRESPSGAAVFAAGLSVVLLISLTGNEKTIIKLVPVTVNGAFFWLFASTLAAGRTPLVTRFASLMRPDMPSAVIIYTRHATIAWSFYFFLMLVISSLLAIYAPIQIWSFFSNILSYVFLTLMFIVEFIVRKRRLNRYMDYTFAEFLLRIRKVDFRSVLR